MKPELIKFLVITIFSTFVGFMIATNIYGKKLQKAEEVTRQREQRIAEIEATAAKIEIKVVEKMKTRIVYRECEHPVDVFQDIEEAFK